MKRILALLILVTAVAVAHGCCKEDDIPYAADDIKETDTVDDIGEYEPPQCLLDAIDLNSDVIRWIEIPDTMLSYSVMYRDGEEEYYLRRNIEGNYSTAGLPFMQQGCSLDEGNIIIYGHYFKTGEMFGSLHDYYVYITYYIEHPKVIVYTPTEKQEWEIFAVSKMKIQEGEFVYNEEKYLNFETEGEFNMYMSYVYANNMIDTGITAHYGDRILVLSTCMTYREGDTERLVLFRKR